MVKPDNADRWLEQSGVSVSEGDGTHKQRGNAVSQHPNVTVSDQDVILKADTYYYVLSKEEKGKDFWYGEKTSTSASPYFSIEGVVMSEDAYDFSFMKETANRILGPVDFVFTIVEQEE